jgi:hypothetical protein
VATGPAQFGADNNAGPNPPNQTVLRAQNSNQATLVVRNEPAASLTAGNGMEVIGGPVAVRATGGQGSDLPGRGVHGVADGTGIVGEGETGVFGNSVGNGNGVWGCSPSATAFKECLAVTAQAEFTERTPQAATVSLVALTASLTRAEQPFSAKAYAIHPRPPAAPMVRPPVFMAIQRLVTAGSSSLGRLDPMCHGLTPGP